MGSVIWACILYLLLNSWLLSARKTYIVQMKHHMKPSIFATQLDWYTSSIESVTSVDSLIYTYENIYHGFAVSLEPEQTEILREADGVIDVFEDTVYSLHTTRTPEFLGLDSKLGSWAGHNSHELNQATQDIIIGVLDTGIWPESKSFDDSGMPDVPSRWRGQCVSAVDFDPKIHCNKKLIGARAFLWGHHLAFGQPTKQQLKSPRDYEGHGTHTASTAAGSIVANASFFGYASGTARGMAMKARVAAYKVCGKNGCMSTDILAAMDRAVMDGVDVLSLSLGAGGIPPYHHAPIAIGAFTAMEKGIFVSCSAGNSGPTKASLENVAPWIMTVGAGTIDRDFPAFARLGNGQNFTGVSLSDGKGMDKRLMKLVYGNSGNSSSNMCLAGSLDPTHVRGNVVLCDRGISLVLEKGEVAREAGAVGMILANTEKTDQDLVADTQVLPTVSVGTKVGNLIRTYVKNEKNPTVVLSLGETVVNVKPSPVLAVFSSRGPNMVTPQILKPDVIGPGVNILAAWSGAIAPTELEEDHRRTPFNIISGTSMSCPHISGLAALLKAAHPNWSPSAIKSALMTTADPIDNTNSPLRDEAGGFANPWGYGSGHVNPHKALSPGLVYDASPNDYIAFLCSLGYTVEQVQMVAKWPNITCSRKFRDPSQLNYPSFSVLFNKSRVVRYTRILTNVGAAKSVYHVKVDAPPTVSVTVKPTKLVFKHVGQRLRYTATFVSKANVTPTTRSAFGSISWRNSHHQVRSPVAFSWTQF